MKCASSCSTSCGDVRADSHIFVGTQATAVAGNLIGSDLTIGNDGRYRFEGVFNGTTGNQTTALLVNGTIRAKIPAFASTLVPPFWVWLRSGDRVTVENIASSADPHRIWLAMTREPHSGCRCEG